MSQEDYAAAIAAFIRSNRITRCPTACVVPTQGVVTPADRIALEHYAMERRRARHQKIAARERFFAGRKIPVRRDE